MVNTRKEQASSKKVSKGQKSVVMFKTQDKPTSFKKRRRGHNSKSKQKEFQQECERY